MAWELSLKIKISTELNVRILFSYPQDFQYSLTPLSQGSRAPERNYKLLRKEKTQTSQIDYEMKFYPNQN